MGFFNPIHSIFKSTVMKKTIHINVSGQLFHVDEDAFEKLSAYLKSLELSLQQQDGGQEIYSDLEARVAELFHEKLSTKSQIVSIEMVQAVIDQIGTPEEMLGASTGESQQEHQESTHVTSRRLYRDGEDKMIGGVAAGIAAYFNIDPTVVRVLAAILILSGVGFGIYLLLWIVIPEAKTPAERLKMKGEPVNLKNLQDQASQEFNEIKSRVNGWMKKEPQNAFERIVAFLGQILQFILKILSKIIRWVLISMLIFFLFTLTIILIGLFFTGIQVGSIHLIPSEIAGILGNSLPEGFDAFSFWAIGFLLVLAPIYWVISISIRMIFNLPKTNPVLKKLNTTVGILSAIGWVLAFVLGVQMAMEFRTTDTVAQSVNLPKANQYTIINESFQIPKTGLLLLEENIPWIITNDRWYQNQVEVDVNDSPDSTAFVKVIRISKGKDLEKAHQLASEIQYSIRVDSTGKITLPSHYSFPFSQPYRAQHVRIRIFLPKSSEIIQQIDDQCTFPTIDRREVANIKHLY
jgi:phage shock protein PspC (stress-responsive transcriptional regulator)